MKNPFKRINIWSSIKEWGLGIVFGLAFFFLQRHLFALYPLGTFLKTNLYGYFIFILAFLMTALWTFANYNKTVDVDNGETEFSGKASLKNGRIWICFWIVWCLYSSFITVRFLPFSWQVILTSLIITIIPGLITFYFAADIRKEDIGYNNSIAYTNEFPTLNTERKYYSGYYGLLCVPLYLIFMSIGLIVKHLISN